MFNILYIGENNVKSTSAHRANALKRLGNNLNILNPYHLIPNNFFLKKFHYYTGYSFLQSKVYSWLKMSLLEVKDCDLIWVNSGELLGEKCLKFLKIKNVPIILYNNDDPTGGRDGNRFLSLLKAIPYYDLCVVMRKINVYEFEKLGAKKVLRVQMSYDEVAHKNIGKIPIKFCSEIAFIGTWMRNEKRDEFLMVLINNNLPVSIWGNRWEKSLYWEKLKPYYRGKALEGQDYVSAIQGAKICLGLLSKGNRDLHTTRSLEIPYAKGLLCAERTSEHLEMYKDGIEAVFWDDVEECIIKCKDLLQNTTKIEAIKENGFQRVLSNKKGNEDMCAKILEYLIFLNK